MFGEKIMMLSLAIGMSFAPSSNLLPLATNTIDSTNVAYDLKIMFGEDDPDHFDLNSLVPTANDREPHFSFYAMYPYDTSLYLYLYDYQSGNPDFYDYSEFQISMSTDQNEDASYNESYSWYKGYFINSYGYNGRFAKFRIDDILDPTIQQRVSLNSCRMWYVQSTGSPANFATREICDEIFIDQTGGVDDLVYDYYSDDYVYIEDSTVAMLLTPSDNKDRVHTTWNGNGYYEEYWEDFYYFFTPDSNHKMDDLIEVCFDYTYVTYNAEEILKSSQLSKNHGQAYTGLLAGYMTDYLTARDSTTLGDLGFWRILFDVATVGGLFVDTAKYGGNISDESLTGDPAILNVVYRSDSKKASTIIRDATDTKWAWRKYEKTYALDTIVDLNNPVEDELYWNLNDFTDAVQQAHVNNGGTAYDWAFLVTSDLRELTDWGKTSGINKYLGETECHEVFDAIVTWVHYKTNDVDFRLDVLSSPTSTSYSFTDSEFFDNLGDQIITFFSSTTSTVLRVLMWLGIAVGALLVVFVFVLIVRRVRRNKKNKQSVVVVNGNTSTTVKNGKAKTTTNNKSSSSSKHESASSSTKKKSNKSKSS